MNSTQLLAFPNAFTGKATHFTVVTTAWVDPVGDGVSGTVGGIGDEVTTGTAVKGAETPGVEVSELDSASVGLDGLEAGGGPPPVVGGVIAGGVSAEEAGTVPGRVPRVVNGPVPVPNSASVERFPFGILYVMLSDGTVVGTDGLDADADWVDSGPDVDGGFGGPADGGPQSKPTRWMPTSHSDCSTSFDSLKLTAMAPPH